MAPTAPGASSAQLADLAHAHACAVLGSSFDATVVAIVAIRRGGRSKTAVLGHARAEALTREAAEADLDVAPPDDLAAFARVLASTRPPVERAIVDLESRYGLDRGGLGRALGMSPADASARAQAVLADWRRDLDPVVLAHLGPGTCPELAAVLEGSGLWRPVPVPADDTDAQVMVVQTATPTVAQLVAIGPAVAEHAATCDQCGDRLRSMVTVRDLLAAAPVEPAPDSVREAAVNHRGRRPTAPIPPLEPPSPLSPRRRWAAIAIGAAVFFVLVAVAVVRIASHKDAGHERVEALTRTPTTGSVISIEPARLRAVPGGPASFTLASHAAVTVRWVASADPNWLVAYPASGRLRPGRSATLSVMIKATVPEGDNRGLLTITASDGSTAVVRVDSTVERPPDVAPSINGCAVSTTVEDESGLGPVVLHWVEPKNREQTAAMAQGPTAYTASLPSRPYALTWWVTAVDGRGNRAKTPSETLAPGAC